jgi:hypothetical protein
VLVGSAGMKKIFSIAFLTVMIVSSVAYVNILHAQGSNYTFFNGVINSDTTWTLANSPYFLTAPVLVNTSATLTIEPGVTVYLNSTYLRVEGILKARGTSTNKISLIGNGTAGGFFYDNPTIEFIVKKYRLE